MFEISKVYTVRLQRYRENTIDSIPMVRKKAYLNIDFFSSLAECA